MNLNARRSPRPTRGGRSRGKPDNGEMKCLGKIAIALATVAALTGTAHAQSRWTAPIPSRSHCIKLTCDNNHSDLKKATIDEAIGRQVG